MDIIAISSSDGLFKIFGLGFMAGGLFSFAVMLVTDWVSDRDEKKTRRKLKSWTKKLPL